MNMGAGSLKKKCYNGLMREKNNGNVVSKHLLSRDKYSCLLRKNRFELSLLGCGNISAFST